MYPLAICPNCRLIFPATDLDLKGAIIRLTDIGVRCPRCRARAFIPDGLYDFSEAASKVARSLASRPAALIEAANLAESAALGKITPTGAVKAANNISAETGSLFSKVFSSFGEAAMIFAALATIYGVFLTHQQNKSSDEVQRQVISILESIVEIQGRNQINKNENIPYPKPRPASFDKYDAGENQPPQGPNRHARRKADAKARKGPK